MELIDKDALVAKIEKRFDEYSSSILKHYDACTEARASELGKILTIIDTFEVKKVDYEKEYRKFLKGFNGNSVPEAAKHFFELGLKAQKID